MPGAQSVTIACNGLVETSDTSGIIGHHAGFMPLWSFVGQTPLTEPGPRMRALAAQLAAQGGERLEVLHALSRECAGGSAL